VRFRRRRSDTVFGGAGGPVLFREGEGEGASAADLGFDPDAAAVHLHDLLDQRQTDAGALELVARGQRLEDAKDALEVLFFDAGTIVADAELPGVVSLHTGDFDSPMRFVHVLDGVGQEVLEDVRDSRPLALDDGQAAFDDDLDVVRRRDGVDDIGQQPVEVDAGPVFLDASDPRVLQDAFNQVVHSVDAVLEQVKLLAALVTEPVAVIGA